MSYRAPYHELAGSNWSLVHCNMAGDWTMGTSTHVVTYDPTTRFYNFTPGVAGFNRFYMVGKHVYPDPSQVVTGYQYGIFNPVAKKHHLEPGRPYSVDPSRHTSRGRYQPSRFDQGGV